MKRFIKICGLSRAVSVEAVKDAEATHVGFVFHAKSPRYIKPLEAFQLAQTLPPKISVVALVADASEQEISEIMTQLRPRVVQFHGSEAPDQIAKFREVFPYVGVWKALGVSSLEDIARADPYSKIVDRLLFDAKPPAEADRRGGHGKAFDWDILNSYSGQTPWLLAGGLTPENIADAIRAVQNVPGFAGVDVSSGVESQPGQKDLPLINRFIELARKAMEQ